MENKIRIAIYCEKNDDLLSLKDSSYELISKMYELKKTAKELLKTEISYEIDAIVIALSLDDNSIQKAYRAGASKVILIQNELYRSFLNTTYALAFGEYLNTVEDYDIILFPATIKSRMLAPRVTTALGAGLVADCINLEFILKNEKLRLAATRPTFGSELMASIISKTKPQCATIREKSFEAKFQNPAQGEFIKFVGNPNIESRIKFLQTLIDKNKDDNDVLVNSDIVLCAGYGLNGQNGRYFEKIRTLAQKIGAAAAATRKVVDFNLMGKNFQIGQTGCSVKPKLYIGFGVSGAIQHICGMKHSKKIVAINTDENAEIFKYSDYKIVADAKKIIDEMLEKIER